MNDNSAKDFEKVDFTASYLSLIKGADKILDTLASVWKYSLTALLLSLSIIGAISIVLFFAFPTRELFFTEGIIFLAIAGWIFARTFTGSCSRCCNADIPHWKRVLASFVQKDNTVDQRDGESVAENLMKVIDATGDWIRLIKRDVFSVLFWPVLAIVIFIFSVYPVELFVVRVVAVLFVIYIFALTVIIYYSVKVKFQGWQEKVSRFKQFTATAIENL